MTTPKATEKHGTVTDFLKGVEPEKRAACRTIGKIMRTATGKQPRMWGSSIVGYGRYHYKYASGREGHWFRCGYAPRARDLTVYIMPGFKPFPKLMARLGKYKTGQSCLYIKRLDDVDLDVLEALIVASVAEMDKRYPVD